MRKILILFFMIYSINIYSSLEKLNLKDYEIIISSHNMKEKQDESLDINLTTREDMMGRGIGNSYIEKILEYRDITGRFENLNELKRIKGIGDATFKKLEKKFKILNLPERKFLYINMSNEKILKYYGFNKKEIKKIRNFIEKKGRITNNLELKKIISKNMYEKLKDKIRYEESENKWED